MTSIASFQRIVESQVAVLNKIERSFYAEVESREELVQMDESLKQSFISQTYSYEIDGFNSMRKYNSFSLSIGIFSFLECGLKEIADFTELPRMAIYFRRVPQKPDNIRKPANRESYIQKYYHSIKAIEGIDLTKAEPYFNNLKYLYFIRNKIAHHNGIFRIRKSEELTERPGLTFLEKNGVFVLLIDIEPYSKYVLKEIELLFTELLTALDKAYENEKLVRSKIDTSAIPNDGRLSFKSLFQLIGKPTSNQRLAKLLWSIRESYEGPVQVEEPFKEDISVPGDDFIFFDFSKYGFVFECVAGYFAQVTFYGVSEDYLTGRVKDPCYPFLLFGDFSLKSTKKEVRERFGSPIQKISHIDQFLLNDDKILAVKYNPSAKRHISWVSIGAAKVYGNTENFPTRIDGIADALDVYNITFRDRIWWSETDNRLPGSDHTMEDIFNNIPDAD